ncbi:MAG: DUF5131 family protein [Solimonas sp.]
MLEQLRQCLPMLFFRMEGGKAAAWPMQRRKEKVQSLRNQAHTHGKAFFFKQYGEWAPHTISDMPPWPYGKGRHAGWIIPVQDLSPPGLKPCCSFGSVRTGSTVLARVGKRRAGRRRDGLVHAEFPKAAT